MTVWIIGKWNGSLPWAFMGVVDNQAAAVAACRTNDYFIGPATLGELLPDPNHVWPGQYYPKRETPATKAFYDHLDTCNQCRENPFDLCQTGAERLRFAAQ
jgi:hypothetical protein